MSRWNVGNIPAVTADEDVDPDVLAWEEEERRLQRIAAGKSARQRIEDMREVRDDGDD